MTKKQIDKAIEHLSLEIIRGEGYCYFLSTTSPLSAVTERGEVAGDQIGESVSVCYFKQLTVERWVWEATYAREVNYLKQLTLAGWEATYAREVQV